MSEIDQDRIRALVATARAQVAWPSRVVVLAGVVQGLAAVGIYALGKLTGHLPVALAGMLLVIPGPILAFAGWRLRSLMGWNLVFGGLMTGVGLWMLAAAVLAYEGLSGWVYLCVASIVGCMGLVVWFASLSENGAIRGARSIVDPQAPRDPADRGPW